MTIDAGDERPCFEKPPRKQNTNGRCMDELPWVQMKQPEKYSGGEGGFTCRVTTQETAQEESSEQELLSHGGHYTQGDD
jgi:hypothetical protein